MIRRRASGQFELPLAAREAFGLFTPEGERDWVPGWDPVYPAGEPAVAPGTVFLTDAHGTTTFWVIGELDRVRGAAVYARVTPGVHAGTVEVECHDGGLRRCRVSITYDLTALGDPDDLEPYTPTRFDEMLENWRVAIETHLEEHSAG